MGDSLVTLARGTAVPLRRELAKARPLQIHGARPNAYEFVAEDAQTSGRLVAAAFWAPAWYHKWHPFNLFTDTPITLSHNNNRPELRVTPRTVSLDVFLGKNEIPVTDIAVVRIRAGTHFLYVDIFTTNETYYGASFVQQQNEDITTPVIEAFTSIGIEVLPE